MNPESAKKQYVLIIKDLIDSSAKKTEDGLMLSFYSLNNVDQQILLGAKLNDKSFNGEPWEWLQESNNNPALQAQFGKTLMFNTNSTKDNFISNLMLEAFRFYANEIDKDIANQIELIELDNNRGF